MIDTFGMEPYSTMDMMDFPADPEPDLRSGVGHGHPRGLHRERPEKYHLKKLQKKTKMQKASKRRNRK